MNIWEHDLCKTKQLCFPAVSLLTSGLLNITADYNKIVQIIWASPYSFMIVHIVCQQSQHVTHFTS